jgi:hypothetical protein
MPKSILNVLDEIAEDIAIKLVAPEEQGEFARQIENIRKDFTKLYPKGSAKVSPIKVLGEASASLCNAIKSPKETPDWFTGLGLAFDKIARDSARKVSGSQAFFARIERDAEPIFKLGLLRQNLRNQRNRLAYQIERSTERLERAKLNRKPKAFARLQAQIASLETQRAELERQLDALPKIKTVPDSAKADETRNLYLRS